MTNLRMNSRWGVEIEGYGYDLENVFEKVNGSILAAEYPFIEMFDDAYVLRSSRWDAAGDFKQLKEAASADLAIISACISILDGIGPITIGTMFEFDSESRVVNRQRQSSTQIVVRRGPAERSAPEEYLTLFLATDDEAIALALQEYRSDDSWFGIYKAVEALGRAFGGEAELIKHFAEDRPRIELLKRTANSYRHTSGKFAPIRNPMPLHEAREYTGQLLARAALDLICARGEEMAGAGSTHTGIELRRHTSPDGKGFVLRPITIPEGSKHAFVGEKWSAPLKRT